SPDSVTQDMIAFQKDLAAVLRTIKDEDSARAAMPKLKAAEARNLQLLKRSTILTNLPKEQKQVLGKKYLAAMDEARTEVLQENNRVRGLGIKDKDFNDLLTELYQNGLLH